jgi:S-layer homology domain
MRRCAMPPGCVMKSLATIFLIFLTCIVVAGTNSLIDRAQLTLSASAVRPAQPRASAADARNGATLAEFARSAQEKLRVAAPNYPVVFDDLRPNDPDYAAAQAIYPFLHRQLLCPQCALESRFLSKESLTRAQAAVVLVSILTEQERTSLLTPEQTAGVLENVSDADTISTFAQPYIATALTDGILQLDSGNMIRPTQPYSRIEMAVAFDTIQRRFPPSAATACLHLAREAAR